MLALSVCLPAPLVNAQQAAPEQQIASARAVFAAMDSQAQACLDSLAPETQGDLTRPCAEFLDALDGPLIADYLADCEQLRQWREAFITSDSQQARSGASAQENLQRLIDIEYYCGEHALGKRTQSVMAAFNRINANGTQAAMATSNTLGWRLLENDLRQQRNGVEGSLLQQRRRLENETQRLWDRLEIELLRQQITRPGDF